MAEIYLDNNATTQPLEEVRVAMFEALGEKFGNPSSAHEIGARARRNVERARDSVAHLIGARGDQITFTSGGTEANNSVLQLAKKQTYGRKLITTTVEHSSVQKMADYLAADGVDVVYLTVGPDGLLELGELERRLAEGPALVSIQWVNNETGVVQDIEAIGNACRSAGALFHTDGAQAVGKMEVRVGKLPVDFLTFTAHKMHGPPGVGAIFSAGSVAVPSLTRGGPQEMGTRPGTENYPGIVGFGVAAGKRMERLQELIPCLATLRDRIEEILMTELPGARVNGEPSRRVCNTTNLQLPVEDGQALVARLDRRGLRCSQSSACTNQRPEPSYVLRAMGLSEGEAYSSVRLGVSELNTREEIDAAAELIVDECEQVQKILGGSRPAAAKVHA